jgi:hypothetical protein
MIKVHDENPAELVGSPWGGLALFVAGIRRDGVKFRVASVPLLGGRE